MDSAAILGLVTGFALIAAAVAMGGAPTAFVDAPAVLIVIGGTLAVTLVSFSLADVAATAAAVARALRQRLIDPRHAATHVLELAELARKRGALALQERQGELATLPFLAEGVSMVIDGNAGDDIERVLGRRVNNLAELTAHSVGVLRRAAEVAPAMGLIGTLVGLVQMLGNLDDPSTIGPGMAVALLTTFYGAILSTMVFSPLAAKLERNANEEILLNTIYLTGVSSISRQENPRRLELVLNTLLPPAQRVEYFD